MKKDQEEWLELAKEVKKFCEDRDIFFGYSDTYYGHFTSLIQEKTKQASKRAVEAITLEEKAIKFICRVCGGKLETSKGMGKTVFSYQCIDCGNYQEEFTSEETGFNEAVADLKAKTKQYLESL